MVANAFAAPNCTQFLHSSRCVNQQCRDRAVAALPPSRRFACLATFGLLSWRLRAALRAARCACDGVLRKSFAPGIGQARRCKRTIDDFARKRIWCSTAHDRGLDRASAADELAEAWRPGLLIFAPRPRPRPKSHEHRPQRFARSHRHSKPIGRSPLGGRACLQARRYPGGCGCVRPGCAWGS